jgi:sugar phosphate isomerase/epimerase
MSAHPRLSLNQASIKYAPLQEALTATAEAGITSIGLWREPVAEVGLPKATELVAASGLRVSSLCRGGFITASDHTARTAALDENRRAIDETAALAHAGAEGSAAVLVLVAGGLPDRDTDLRGARERVQDGIGHLVEHAHGAGVTLAVEPMHPVYAADRGVISTLGQALDIAEPFPANTVGVVVDAFHIWWDPEVFDQIARAGAQGRIASYQVNDWITPLPADSLLARGVMGHGHIDLPRLTQAVLAAGYTGDVEVEIFNQQLWDMPYQQAASLIAVQFDAIAMPTPNTAHRSR